MLDIHVLKKDWRTIQLNDSIPMVEVSPGAGHGVKNP
jgi:hypothetical protein